MRKQLHEIEDIDNYVFKKMAAPERVLFEAKLIVAPELRTNLLFQQRAYSMIRWFGRKKRKEQLECLFTSLMRDPHFSTTVNSIFK
jgi:hypothetical protein